MILKQLPVGAFATNCFLVFMPETRELFIIDPGAEPETIAAEAKKFPFSSARILLTHAHIDHISACGKVAQLLGVEKIELSPDDVEMYLSPANALEPYFSAASDLPPPADFDAVTNCEIIALPGHTRGGTGFLFDDGKERFLIAGDTIFCGSIGRTDLPGGSWETICRSLRRLAQMEDDYIVHPGHGESTALAQEKMYNPYMQ